MIAWYEPAEDITVTSGAGWRVCQVCQASSDWQVRTHQPQLRQFQAETGQARHRKGFRVPPLNPGKRIASPRKRKQR